MVKIAIAGGSGQVAREVIDVLLATDKHQVMLFTRTTTSPPVANEIINGVAKHVVDYDDIDDLVAALHGVHTVLSFIQVLSDVNQKSQRNLIDAAILAGVKRFAPSEYGSAGTENMPWWEGKQKIREYLEKVNRPKKKLEYCLFQPGLFLNYLAFPYKTSKHLEPLGTVFDFQNHRAILVQGHETAFVTLTTVTDFAHMMVMAVDFEDEWPTVGGIQGTKVTVTQIIEIGERVRDRPFVVENVRVEDLEHGKLTASWGLEVPHKAVPAEVAKQMVKEVTIGMLLSMAKGAWGGSDELNRMFPGYKFTALEAFLADSVGTMLANE